MEKNFLYSVAALTAVIAVYLLISATGVELPQVKAFYYYGTENVPGAVVGDIAGVVLAYLFVVIGSLIFFGKATPLVMALEGLKYASLYVNQTMAGYDFLFLLPQLIAAYAGTTLMASVEADFDHKGTLHRAWQVPLLLFIAGGALTIAIFLARNAFL